MHHHKFYTFEQCHVSYRDTSELNKKKTITVQHSSTIISQHYAPTLKSDNVTAAAGGKFGAENENTRENRSGRLVAQRPAITATRTKRCVRNAPEGPKTKRDASESRVTHDPVTRRTSSGQLKNR